MGGVITLRPISEALEEEGAYGRVSTYLRTILGWRGQTANDFGKSVGLDQHQISKRMHGHVRWTPIELQTIAYELGVPVEDMLAGVPEPPWRFKT